MGRAPGALAELATVVDVHADTYTYAVKTESGRPLNNLGRKRTHPSDVSLLPHGTTVIVRYDLPFPYIDGVLDMPMSRGAGFAAAAAGAGVTGTTGYGGQGISATPSGGVTGGANFRAEGEPTDMIPGDNVLAHSSGSRIGALEGSVALLMGSVLAQVRAHGLGDLVEIISRNYRHVTDFGVFEVKNKGGKVGLSFRGGTDQLTEAGKGEEHWTVRFDVGADADILDFRLTTPSGENLFTLHIDGDGRCNVYAADGIVKRTGSSSTEATVTETAGSIEDSVGGDATHRVDGSRAASTGQDATHTVGGTWNTSAVADALLSAGRDLVTSAGRRAVIDAQGDASSRDPALELRARDGDIVFRAGHVPHPQSKIRAETLKGSVELASTQGGNITLETLLGEIRAAARKITLNTSAPDSVILGGSSLIGHVAIYEVIERVLIFLASGHDTHTHTAPNTPPVIPLQPTMRGMLSPAKSRNVGVGG